MARIYVLPEALAEQLEMVARRGGYPSILVLQALLYFAIRAYDAEQRKSVVVEDVPT